MKKIAVILFLMAALCFRGHSQSAIVRDFRPACDSLNSMLNERAGIQGKLRLKAVMKRGKVLDFYFTESLSDHPLRKGDAAWFRKKLRELFPDKWKGYSVGSICTKQIPLERLETHGLGFSGTPASPLSKSGSRHPVPVRELGGMEHEKGLSGNTIAVWNSHGMYFDCSEGRWQWQRPCLFSTVEDLYTSGYVLSFLVPMLENAGAYVMMPRERDLQTNEVVADNDPCYGGRGTAVYSETGTWSSAGTGFADVSQTYGGHDNPFAAGTARKAQCMAADAKGTAARAEWRPEIPERGEYAVYVSYKTLPESTDAAHYTVSHLGGKSEFAVNQKIGGGTWIYLGTFEFEKGSQGYVSLSSRMPEGHGTAKGKVVTADAVRFGGGKGNIARGTADSPAVTSGMPRFAEGARYFLQWSGADKSIYSQNDQKNDYKDDFMSRGDWVDWISGGSAMNPGKEGKGIPVDLAIGFHSDAGITPNDSIIGTLAIYTLKSEGRETLPCGENRMTSRQFADMVQSQAVHDIKALHEPQWTRREIWDRGYRESRTPSSPSMLLELLSHQNFADMKYGLDPAFRFTVSRAVYKGMLKYLAERYGRPYSVQPLPVSAAGVSFGKNGTVSVSWEETDDPAEPTAAAKGYILYTRVDDGGFDSGKIIRNTKKSGGRHSTEVRIEPGHIYSFRIVAYNDGGISFPSETVCAGIPDGHTAEEEKVLVVNNFSRISGPAFFDTPQYAGFDAGTDRGVAYMRDMTYIGDMYEFRRDAEWLSNDNPGFGASWSDYAGKINAGNNFDYPYVHGKAIMKTGRPFFSCSSGAFLADEEFMKDAWSIDLICGKQVSTPSGPGSGSISFEVFSESMQDAIRSFTSGGGNVLVSGAYIGTDIWDSVYPVEKDGTATEKAKSFATGVLGYKWIRNRGTKTGLAEYAACSQMNAGQGDSIEFHTAPNPYCYCAESPDAIAPAGNGNVFMKYSGTGLPAAVCHRGYGYRTVCVGFPIETVKNEDDIYNIISATFEFFRQ